MTHLYNVSDGCFKYCVDILCLTLYIYSCFFNGKFVGYQLLEMQRWKSYISYASSVRLTYPIAAVL